MFPVGIKKLQNLIILDAFSNSFTGSLPLDVCNITSLNVINFAGSYFSGPIPGSYGILKNLNLIHLAGNMLTYRNLAEAIFYLVRFIWFGHVAGGRLVSSGRLSKPQDGLFDTKVERGMKEVA